MMRESTFFGEHGVESQEQVESMAWQDIIQLTAQGNFNEIEMEALKMQAQMRLEHLNNMLPGGTSRLTLDQVRFDVDLVKKQVIRAQAIESVK